MSKYIADTLYKELPLTITKSIAEQVIRLVLQFEIRGEHPLTLNSQLVGCNTFTFTRDDRKQLFDIFGVDEDVLNELIAKIASINTKFRVASDALNIFIMYAAHLFLVSKLPTKLVHDATISILAYLQYRMIGSIINHYFPHGADRDTMVMVTESLSMKFAIRQAGTWRNVIYNRANSVVFDDKAHHNTLIKFNNDEDILYLITDTSTRIRSQFKIIAANYYELKSTGTKLTSIGATTTTIDGEKILRERDNAFVFMSSAITNKMRSKLSFVDEKSLRIVQSSVPRITTGLLKRTLLAIVDEYHHQLKEGTQAKIIAHRDGTVEVVGIAELIHQIIQTVYNLVIRSPRININNKLMVYLNTKNIFTASRITNMDVIGIKDALGKLIVRLKISTRENTVGGLVVGIVLYITLMSFHAIHK